MASESNHELLLREVLEVCQKWSERGVSQGQIAEICLYIAAIECLNANIPERDIHIKIDRMIDGFCSSFIGSGNAVSHLPVGEA